MTFARHRLPADPADWPALPCCRSGHRNVYWNARLQRYAIDVKYNGRRIVRYAKNLSRAIAIARALRRDLFGQEGAAR